MADITILEEQTLSGFEDMEGVGYLESPALFPPFTAGTNYRILWEGTEYICTAMSTDGAGFVGNMSIGDPSAADTGEPFIIAVMPGALIGAPVDVMVINTTQTGTEHTLAVYEIGEEETIPSATVKIKGYSGAEFTYENVPKVWLAAPESTMDNPVLVPFTYGEAVDNVEVIPDFSAGDHKLKLQAGELIRCAVVRKPAGLIPGNIKAGETIAGIPGEYEGEVPETEEVTVPADFSDGDMVLEPSEGKFLTKATVQMPETLIPENVAEGVNIAGIIGSFVGGSNAKFSYGTFTGEGKTVATVNHGMGIVPDIIFVITSENPSSTSYNALLCAAGISLAMKEAAEWSVSSLSGGTIQYGADRYVIRGSKAIDEDYRTFHDAINNANTENFKVGNHQTFPNEGSTYQWLAIGGLT